MPKIHVNRVGTKIYYLMSTKKEALPRAEKARPVRPEVQTFTVKELKSLKVPDFQRWINESNKEELKYSINEVGILRCPIVAKVKEDGTKYIIDGNHLRLIIVEDKSNKPTDLITCIYQEVDTYAKAAERFKMLNTKGKKLDWVDYTNLYMNIQGANSVYGDVWRIIGNPGTPEDVHVPPGFSLATIIEVLCNDKKKYREGKSEKGKNYNARKNLLNFLLQTANESWSKKFGKDGRRPTGAAIIGFMNAWFNHELHKKYEENEFLNIVNEIYEEKQDALKSGETVINRDNAGKLLELRLEAELREPVS